MSSLYLGSVKFNKKNLLAYSIFIYCSFAFFFIYWGMSFPLRIAEFIILLSLVINNNYRAKNGPVSGFSKNILIIFTVEVICSAIYNRCTIVSFLEEYITYLSIILFIYFFYTLLNQAGLKKMLRLIDCLYWINLMVYLYQAFVLHITRDELTGIFGAVTGNGGYLNLLLCFYSIYVVLRYLYKMTSVQYVLCVVATTIFQAVLGEIKIYFFEMIALLLVITIFHKFSVKKVSATAGMIMAAIIGVYFIGMLYPSFKNFISVSFLISDATNSSGYTHTGDIGRFNGISILKRYMTQSEFYIGLGPGNSAEGTYFYQKYNYLHYNWFTYSKLFVDSGIVGLGTLVCFYLGQSLYAFRKFRRCTEDLTQKMYYEISMLAAFINTALMFYNTKMLTVVGAAYIGFFMALPYIYSKRHKSTNIEKGESQ